MDLEQLLPALLHDVEQQKLLSPVVLSEVQEHVCDRSRSRLGSLALRRGHIEPWQLVQLICELGESPSRIGELAVQHGWMTEDQVEVLLSTQRDPVLLVVQFLQPFCRFSDEEIRDLAQRHSNRPPSSSPAGAEMAPSEPPLDFGEEQPPLSSRLLRPAGKRVRQVLQSCKELTALPVVIQKALHLLGNDDVSLNEVAKLIQSDVALTAQVLRLANSAFFGARRSVETVRQALSLIGTASTRQLLITTTFLQSLTARKDPAVAGLWGQALHCSTWSQALARGRVGSGGLVPPEGAVVGGLLSDLGRVVILQHLRAESVAIRNQMRSSVTLSDAEVAVLGVTHQDVGAYVCRCWDLPAELAEAVLLHHTGHSELRNMKLTPLTNVVNLACRLADFPLKCELDQALDGLGPGFFEYHRVDKATLLSMAPHVRKEALGHASLLG